MCPNPTQGAYFGENVFFGHYVRTESVNTEFGCKLCLLSKRAFDGTRKRFPQDAKAAEDNYDEMQREIRGKLGLDTPDVRSDGGHSFDPERWSTTPGSERGPDDVDLHVHQEELVNMRVTLQGWEVRI